MKTSRMTSTRTETYRTIAAILIAALLIPATTAAGTASEESVPYVAIGDSYSSGEGNPPFTQGSAFKCHRSTSNAWPASVRNGAGKRIDFTANLACSGATSAAFTESFKGQSPQISALAKQSPKPGLITLTLGGNDIGFASVIRDCLIIDCVQNGTLTRTSDLVERTLPAKLSVAYQALRKEAGNARILVVGYPQIFPSRQQDSRNCGLIEPAERDSLNRLAALLDTKIAAAAQDSGFEYVSTRSVMAGHELCTVDSWMVPVGVKRDNSGAAHPGPLGQAAIVGAVNRYLSDRPVI